MKAIFDLDSKSRLERDVLYKHVGGITATRFQSFLETKEVIHSKVGHMVLDKNSAYVIENKQDLEIVKSINNLYQII